MDHQDAEQSFLLVNNAALLVGLITWCWDLEDCSMAGEKLDVWHYDGLVLDYQKKWHPPPTTAVRTP